MTHLSLADASTHIDAARRTYHHYNNHSTGHGHLSTGAAVAVIVILLIIAVGYGLYKVNSSNSS